MKKIHIISLFLITIITLTSCSPVKVLSAWKADPEKVETFRKKKVLVIARTADNQARIAFESGFADEMRRRGIEATESFQRAPKIHAQREMTEERLELMRTMLKSEGYDGIVITVVKDKQQSLETSSSGMYVGAGYSSFYPGYYGGFYDYYSYPYAYGPYYSGFGGYVPVAGSTTTRVRTDYVLETLAYNLDQDSKDQLVAVVTTSITDPRDAYKVADQYVEALFKELDKVDNTRSTR